MCPASWPETQTEHAQRPNGALSGGALCFLCAPAGRVGGAGFDGIAGRRVVQRRVRRAARMAWTRCARRCWAVAALGGVCLVELAACAKRPTAMGCAGGPCGPWHAGRCLALAQRGLSRGRGAAACGADARPTEPCSAAPAQPRCGHQLGLAGAPPRPGAVGRSAARSACHDVQGPNTVKNISRRVFACATDFGLAWGIFSRAAPTPA